MIFKYKLRHKIEELFLPVAVVTGVIYTIQSDSDLLTKFGVTLGLTIILIFTIKNNDILKSTIAINGRKISFNKIFGDSESLNLENIERIVVESYTNRGFFHKDMIIFTKVKNYRLTISNLINGDNFIQFFELESEKIGFNIIHQEKN